MAKNKNKNIVPIRSLDELKDEVLFCDYDYKNYFEHIANLIPNIPQERLDLEVLKTDRCNEKGLVYIFVIAGKIFKIGQSITNIKERLNSYNCGKIEYRISGTNSTTNYFVLQSLLKINERVEVYAFFPDKPTYTLFGETFHDSYPPAKKAENILINDFIKKHNRKPIGCTQR